MSGVKFRLFFAVASTLALRVRLFFFLAHVPGRENCRLLCCAGRKKREVSQHTAPSWPVWRNVDSCQWQAPRKAVITHLSQILPRI